MNRPALSYPALLLAPLILAAGAGPPTSAAGVSASPNADPVTFTGRVTADSSQRPLPGAQVSVTGLNAGAVTGPDGRYSFRVARSRLRGTRVTLRARLIGFETQTRTVTVSGDTARVNFELRAAPVSMDEVTVAHANLRPVSGRAAAARTSGVHPHPWPPPDFNTEQYERIVENPFLSARSNPLSTFGVDVDRASYGNVRRFLKDGQLPPKDAVRIEELVNYFSYDYPEPDGEAPFSVTTEVAPAPWRPNHRLLRIGLQAERVELGELPPSNLVFLIDVSGSMRSPDKLPLLKSSLRLLVEELRPKDRVAIVVYAGSAGLVLEPTSGSEKRKIRNAIDGLEAGGSTAGGEGLRLAYEVAAEHHLDGGNNRVILATDGDFNVGVSSDAAMRRLVEEKREQGTFLTVLGFGTGNLKDAKMEEMADHGNGNYSYIDSLLEARKTLVTELGGTLLTVAKDVKVQVEFNPNRVEGYRLIGYENRLLRDEDFGDDEKDAGDIGAGHSVTALYEVVPVGAETSVEIRSVDSLRYQETRVRPESGDEGELAYVKLRYKEPDGEESRLLTRAVRDRPGEPSRDFLFASSVAAFGMVLRDSKYRGEATPDRVLELARRGRGPDPHGYRAEFIRLVEAAKALGVDSAEAGDGEGPEGQ